MWAAVARVILRYRITILLLLGLVTVLMGLQTRSLVISYGVPKLLPEVDSTYLSYQDFKKTYGNEAIAYVVGIDKNPLQDLTLFNAWRKLGQDINKITGVDTLVSVTNNLFYIHKNSIEKKFEILPVISRNPVDKKELDSLRNFVESLPFYKGKMYNSSTGANLMLITLDSAIFNSDERSKMVAPLMGRIQQFEEEQSIEAYISGLPFVRTIMRTMVQKELGMFVALAMLVTILVLFFFFRTFNPVVSSMLVVAIGVVWSFGSIPLFGFEVNVLTGLIPPLVIVIAVPNCIYLINKYHGEYNKHGNQARALHRMIQKIGSATLMTNATTAIGFATFIFTESTLLKEFGIVAAFNIMSLFVIAMAIIPITLSYLGPPQSKHTKHLNKSWMNGVVEILVNIVSEKRKLVYLFTLVIVLIGFWGVSRMETTGNMVDDLPKNHFVVNDLKWVEQHFNGVMPFEVTIDTKKLGMVKREHVLKKIDKLQTLIAGYPQFSKPLSLVEGVKFMKQGFYNTNPDKYELINSREKVFFKPYLDKEQDGTSWIQSYVDDDWQKTRVSFYVADIGTKEIDALLEEIRPRVDSIFSPKKYTVDFTGSSLVFLKGTTYLVKNLFVSLALAIILVSILMAALFSSFRMVFVSMSTNMLPLLLTAAAMGFTGVAIKPSTILVFGIAFGISVDDTIHFLAKYRQELKAYNWDIGKSVIMAIRETGVSMIYTSIILFFGFSVFTISEFGGTMALGFLVSFTLLLAMLSNLVLLPSLLLSLEKTVTTKAFDEPFLETLDEEEDIDLSELKIGK